MTTAKSPQLTQDYLKEIQQMLEERDQKATHKRQYNRFDHHSGTMITLKVRTEAGEWQKANGFIKDESFGGLGILAITPCVLSINQLCQILMPGIGWIDGRIAWLRSLDSSVQELGIRYNHV